MNAMSANGIDMLHEAFISKKSKYNTDYGSNAAIGGAGLAYLSSSGNNARCPINDMSFMCQLSRTVSITSMIIYLIVVFAIIIYILYMLYKYMKSKK